MQENRRGRLAAVILQELSRVVPREVKDPRVPTVTFTEVEVTEDGSEAKVYFAILGGPRGVIDGDIPPLSEEAARLRVQDCMAGLNSAAGFLRRHLAKVLTIRHIPKLQFKSDQGLENSARVFDLLKKIEAESKSS
jgi:ribosome-binding factor A